MVVVSSAKLAKEVLKTHDLVFCSRPSILGQQKLSYNGRDIVFSRYNDCWRELRKICVLQLFSLKKVQSFSPVRQDEVFRMINRISQQAATCQITNLSKFMISLSSTIICRVAFGIRYDEEAHERKRFNFLLEEAGAMMTSFFVSDFFPSLSWIDKLTGVTARLEKIFKDLDEFYKELIEQHLNPNRPKSMEGDILDILLQLKKEKLTPIDLTLEDIKALVMNVLLAGSDTSAAAVVWTMTALMKNPKAMKKVQEEIRKSVGKKSNIVTEDDIQNLPYFKAVIKETFRLYPPVPVLLPRESMEISTLEGYEIQPRSIIHVKSWAISRDPEIWENSEEFIPERFLNSNIEFKGQDFDYIPFGAGRRGCPGIALGVASMELALSNLLYAFDWELPCGMEKEDIDTDVKPGITMHKKNELCLIPKNYL
ncbi:cytochrome p450 83b1 [Nicotiana attenuata]|uniref:Cytochrome p450 83b1 n=2 Tax=Nicotiana attenuata TaxID=49451 RepID=A0A1J6JZ61_NICAT|nr:cytochrome p450 83b1 [Nicotiana attenuata]